MVGSGTPKVVCFINQIGEEQSHGEDDDLEEDYFQKSGFLHFSPFCQDTGHGPATPSQILLINQASKMPENYPFNTL